MHAINKVFEFPPSESESILVNFEFLKKEFSCTLKKINILKIFYR